MYGRIPPKWFLDNQNCITWAILEGHLGVPEGPFGLLRGVLGYTKEAQAYQRGVPERSLDTWALVQTTGKERCTSCTWVYQRGTYVLGGHLGVTEGHWVHQNDTYQKHLGKLEGQLDVVEGQLEKGTWA